MSKQAMREESERLVREAMEKKSISIKKGDTRIEAKCGKCGTINKVTAANWVVEAFAKTGIRYLQSERDRSAIYLDALPLFTSGRARLIDNARLVAQFAALERRTFSTGRDVWITDHLAEMTRATVQPARWCWHLARVVTSAI
jgi:hypothetical protein